MGNLRIHSGLVGMASSNGSLGRMGAKTGGGSLGLAREATGLNLLLFIRLKSIDVEYRG